MEGRCNRDDGTSVGLLGMELKGRIVLVLLAGVVSALIAVGCGGGSSSSSDSASSSASTAASEATTSEGSQSEPSGDEPSKEFIGKGADGKLAKVGKEASEAEREAVSEVLEKSFTAQEEGDWAEQCSTLAASTVQQLEKSATVLGSSQGCAKALETQAAPLPPSARASKLTGPIDALRINQGINGFAFWHGAEGKDYVIPLINQDGWKLVFPTPKEIE